MKYICSVDLFILEYYPRKVIPFEDSKQALLRYKNTECLQLNTKWSAMKEILFL